MYEQTDLVDLRTVHYTTGMKLGRLPTNDIRMRGRYGYLTLGNDEKNVSSQGTTSKLKKRRRIRDVRTVGKAGG